MSKTEKQKKICADTGQDGRFVIDVCCISSMFTACYSGNDVIRGKLSIVEWQYFLVFWSALNTKLIRQDERASHKMYLSMAYICLLLCVGKLQWKYLKVIRDCYHRAAVRNFEWAVETCDFVGCEDWCEARVTIKTLMKCGALKLWWSQLGEMDGLWVDNANWAEFTAKGQFYWLTILFLFFFLLFLFLSLLLWFLTIIWLLHTNLRIYAKKYWKSPARYVLYIWLLRQIKHSKNINSEKKTRFNDTHTLAQRLSRYYSVFVAICRIVWAIICCLRSIAMSFHFTQTYGQQNVHT